MFSKNECHYKILIAAFLILQVSPGRAEDRLHTIVVADTLSQDIAADMEISSKQIKEVIEHNMPADLLCPSEIKGNRFRRQIVLTAIAQLSVAPGDAVLFYYCGHGKFEDEGGGVFFEPPSDNNGERLYLSEIQNALGERKPRFSAVIVDCCSEIVSGPVGAVLAAAPVPKQVSPLFTALFFNGRGTIVLKSSKPGELALCRGKLPDRDTLMKGALFTQVLSDAWYDAKPREWREVYEECRDAVDKKFQLLKNADGLIPLGRGTLLDQATQTVTGSLNDEDL